MTKKRKNKASENGMDTGIQTGNSGGNTMQAIKLSEVETPDGECVRKRLQDGLSALWVLSNQDGILPGLWMYVSGVNRDFPRDDLEDGQVLAELNTGSHAIFVRDIITELVVKTALCLLDDDKAAVRAFDGEAT